MSSYSRQYTVQPTSEIASVDNTSLAQAMCVVGHGRQTYVAAGSSQDGLMSAIGFNVRIEDNKLFINDQAEIIKVCEANKIVTQFTLDQHFVTKEYKWNGLRDNDGQIDIASDILVNVYNKDATQMNFLTRRLVIWKDGAVDQKLFTQDSRIVSRTSNRSGTEGRNTADLSNRTNIRRADGKSICEDIPQIQ